MNCPWRLIVTACVLWTAGGCHRGGSSAQSNVSIDVAGRHIQVHTQGSTSISNQGDAAVILFDDHKLVIEKDRIILDGQEQARLPATARQITIERASGQITMTVDGQAVPLSRGS